MTLTDKQRLFIESYLQCFNATEAARRAGYQGDSLTLASVGCENLRKPYIAEFITNRIEEVCLTTDQSLALLAAHASFDPGPYLIVNENGEPSIDIKKLKSAGLTSTIKSITPTRNGTRIEFESRQGAIDKILRTAGAYQDRIDVTSGDEPIADLRTEILSALHSISTASAENTDN